MARAATAAAPAALVVGFRPPASGPAAASARQQALLPIWLAAAQAGVSLALRVEKAAPADAAAEEPASAPGPVVWVDVAGPGAGRLHGTCSIVWWVLRGHASWRPAPR